MTEKTNPTPPDASALARQMQEAVAAHQAGKLREAEALYRAVLSAAPDCAEAHHMMGLAALQSGRGEDAVDAITKAISAAPSVPDYRVALAQALAGLGRFADAAEACRAALGIEPDFAPALMGLGNVLAASGDHSEAMDSFRRALALRPDLAEGHYNLANAERALGKPEDAARSYRAALALAPGFFAAHLNLANVLRDLGRFSEAEAHYRDALRLNPQHASAHTSLGDILRNRNEVDEAIACYRAARELEPGNPWKHYDLGRGLRARGETEDAIACYLEAIRLDPRFTVAHASLGDAYKSIGRLDDAIASYQAALALDPGYDEARTNLGLTLQQEGRIDDAIAEFERLGGRIGTARVLECLFAADRRPAFRDVLAQAGQRDPANLRAAAIAAFAAHQWGEDNTYPFCADPLRSVQIDTVTDALSPFPAFVSALLDEIDRAPAVWNPQGNATKGGFHTTGNLFELETPRIAQLRDVILAQIAAYRAGLTASDDALSARWPDHPVLYGWHVKLLQSGYMDPHIHTSGWVSGVVYLRMPGKLAADEGGIAFSLHGYDYPVSNPDIPTVRHHPKEGDVVLFPSSLFHHTQPFPTDEARHCIAFDLCPR